MKKLIAALLALTSINAFAANMTVTSCEDYSVSLNSVYSMKTYANSSVKVFEIDMIEPAAAPVGVAIAIDRGSNLADMESFCRFVPGLSSADVTGAKSKYDKATNILTLTFNVSQTNEDGISKAKVLTVVVNKGAASEENLVKASLK